MKNLSKNLVYGIMILLTIALIGSVISETVNRPEEIALAQLVQNVKEEKVAKIVVQENILDIELKDGTKLKSRKETEVGLSETFKNYGVEPEKFAPLIEVKEQSGFVFWLSVMLPFLAPVIIIGFFIWWSARQFQRGSMQAFSFGQSKARLILPNNKKERVTFKDVAGVKEAKEELKEIVDFLKNPKKFIDIGARIPRGVLLMGAPGTGKTLLAKAVAGEAGVPFYQISGSEFVEMFVGVGASRVRDLFKHAKKTAPSIIFIDEIDAVGRHRGTGIGGGHDEREQTLNQILVEMDGFETTESIIVMAATNRPDVLDPALLRPGRFDRRVILDLPDINDREEILKIHAKNKPLAKDINVRMIAERTPGFSGADLSNLVNESAILAARENRKTVTELDMIQSIEKVMLGPERKSHILSVEEKEISAYHEAGHALVAASLKGADPVHKISIVSRGRAAGYTLKLPSQDRHLYSRTHFLNEIAIALGGYTAEKIIFSELTTGASDDLRKASDIARDLVMRYGMSEKIGPAVYGEHGEMVFLGKELGTERNYSEDIAKLIDTEVRSIINGCFKKAKEVITTRRAKLEEIAGRLVEKETIEKDEFAQMMAAA
ncbi:MAG: cell division protein FtsH [Candidatus Sungbacteria bacterium RIFCSPLOWO2_01_FULL_47_10]|uniref:ATP-dependent zinc metalloprotease FtsH n=1 Tax=Candidatus Sungbacteria bacterium RIFCSPLOWO2_01_FULL_47_10 TaxID=1802276 RepID=A0A1G2L2A6_9BACT|nr:MAG: cell division protein FtsH [Candidatus Sungbacteria bacterium RIFCSPLOWO2_01_FULL_47_10]